MTSIPHTSCLGAMQHEVFVDGCLYISLPLLVVLGLSMITVLNNLSLSQPRALQGTAGQQLGALQPTATNRLRSQPSKLARSCACQASKHDGFEGFDEIITFVTSDGIVRFPGRLGNARHMLLSRPNKSRQQPMPSWEEQKLCIGASFMVAARNDHDPTRRINIAGFCQSVDLLFDSVEDIVMLRGGEILDEERQLKSGLHEELKLTVTLPYLWGIPPTLDCLRSAIEVGGGIIDRVYHRWDIY